MSGPYAEGSLRLDPSAPEPWRYRGDVQLPGGRWVVLNAMVKKDDAGRFFALRLGLQPGMNAAELEAVLSQIEIERARDAQRELESTDELPF